MGHDTVMVDREELTFEERYQILRRLQFWAGLFARQAEDVAMGKQGATLEELTKGLEEKRLLILTPDSADRLEQNLMNMRDPVELWRTAKALDNHRFALAEETARRFPEQREKLKYLLHIREV